MAVKLSDANGVAPPTDEHHSRAKSPSVVGTLGPSTISSAPTLVRISLLLSSERAQASQKLTCSRWNNCYRGVPVFNVKTYIEVTMPVRCVFFGQDAILKRYANRCTIGRKIRATPCPHDCSVDYARVVALMLGYAWSDRTSRACLALDSG